MHNRGVTLDRVGPTEAERRAIQRAVDQGDHKRAEELLSGVRRRLAKSKKRKKFASSTAGKQGAAKKSKSRTASKRTKDGGGIRVVGATRFTLCPVCRREFSVNRDGCLRAHGNLARVGKCRGSGVKVAKAWKTSPVENSVRTVSGGLPSLGKRR